MATYKTQGIIIRRQANGEADRILTILTKDHGTVQGVARGVRKAAAKLAGSLELFYVCQFRLVEGKTFDTVVESTVISTYPAISHDLGQFQLASYLAELIDKTTHVGQKHEDVYELLLEAFAVLPANSFQTKQFLLDYFLLRLLSCLGYRPVLDHCVVGRENLIAGENGWLSNLGGVVCSAHRPRGETVLTIHDNTIKLMRLILAQPFDALRQVKIPDAVGQQLHGIIQDFFDHHFDINLKSKKYFYGK